MGMYHAIFRKIDGKKVSGLVGEAISADIFKKDILKQIHPNVQLLRIKKYKKR
jgi:hypothetical protein